jgi:hypothetical protein
MLTKAIFWSGGQATRPKKQYSGLLLGAQFS